ncbi:MAG: 5-oxoprolinase subunit PxpB [Bacillota bacterium]
MITASTEPRLLVHSERGIVVEFGDSIDPTIFDRVRALTQALEQHPLNGVIELIPTYRSVLVHFDPLHVDRTEVMQWIHQHLQTSSGRQGSARVVVIPTLYGGEFGPDLADVAQHAGLASDEVVQVHSSEDYLVYMIGFTPGFPYLGGLSPKIACPRLSSPRTLVPAGSVGIAETQTGIYPLATPGGWRLIGRTPLKLFDPASAQPFVLQAGDYLRFRPIDTKEYDEISSLVKEQRYQAETRVKGAGQ